MTAVRFVRSRDGTRIAYSVTGDGPALLHFQVPSLSHIELYPKLHGAKDYLDRLGEGRKLIRMDFRGTGMSEREFEDHSPEALTNDAEAVIDDLGIDEMDLFAGGARVTPALGLALRRPGTIGRMILSFPFTVRPPGERGPVQGGVLGLMESNWELFLEFTTQRNTGLPIRGAREVISFIRRCMDQRNYVLEEKAARPSDDWERARLITIPTLVLEFTDNVSLPQGRIRRFAENFPNGQFIALPETEMPPPYGNPDLVVQAVREFLGQPRDRQSEIKAPRMDQLTPREAEVLRLLARGRTQPEIAVELVISEATVSNHVGSVYGKIGAHRRADAVSWAIRNGFG